SYSMLERLVDKFGPAIYRRLDIQYRMHQAIMSFSSDQFYDGGLIADPSVASHLLSDLEPVESNPLTTSPITFIDTAGAGWEEEVEPDGESRRNLSEARLILSKVRTLHEMGVAYGDMGVIAPYAAQVRWLRQQSDDDDLEIDTVDGFQGREKEVVLISTVRSNNTGEIGFLADTRRMNVALTRARRKLVVVGDSATLGGHEFFADLLAYFELIGAYHTVWEEDVDAY
ncbi:MAG: C-terminal helicase domain-containing protein, partial [Planctomycetales bacterium]|nr:C-terminal helicase domain-containing protein [Planctomycetales bacterium]